MKARDFIEQLKRDPEYQARLAEDERKRAEFAAVLAADEAPLVEALKAAGSEVVSVWDLVNTADRYPHLVGVLAEHLQRPYHFCTREGIARALTVPEARGTAVPRVLMNELKAQADASSDIHQKAYRWALVNALVMSADASLREDFEPLLHDPRYADLQPDLLRVAKRLSKRHRPRR